MPDSAVSPDVSPSAAAEVADRFTAALLALERDGDAALDPMTALFAADARFDSPSLRQAGVERSGADGTRTFWSEYIAALGGAMTEFHRVTTGARAIGLFWTTRGASGAAGEPAFAYDGSTLLELDGDGRIARFSACFDPRELDPKRAPA